MKNFLRKVAKSFHSGEKGFTLIELLIVIVILGVLAAAIIPNLSKFVGSGNVGAANAELASVRTAVAAYQSENNGTSPANIVANTAGWYNIYFGGGKNCKGAYTIAADGGVTGTAYAGLFWDCPAAKWAAAAVACP
jgi:type IV pilus assembly protein PilA